MFLKCRSTTNSNSTYLPAATCAPVCKSGANDSIKRPDDCQSTSHATTTTWPSDYGTWYSGWHASSHLQCWISTAGNATTAASTTITPSTSSATTSRPTSNRYDGPTSDALHFTTTTYSGTNQTSDNNAQSQWGVRYFKIVYPVHSIYE